MHQVTRFESTLLKILHAMLGRAPAAQALKLLVRRWARPRCLSRECVKLVQDALAKGCTWWLATGGWRSETFLRGEAAAAGRLWQRTLPAELGLEFSGFALDFLIWLTEADVSSDDVWQPYEEESLTVGDRLLLSMALDAVAETEIGLHWAASPPFAGDGMCALLHPELMAHAAANFPPNFEPWLTTTGQSVLEAAQHRLARSWNQLESAKATMISRDRMMALGQAQTRTLEAFLAAIDRAGRRDLARWVLIALEESVAGSPDVSRWIGGLDVKGLRVAQRTEIYRSAVAFLRAAAQLSNWQQQAAGTGYFDEGYAASQIWKSDWERYNGQAAIAVAQRIARAAEPLA